ncbi:hypothetical protein WME90_29950 [Sorangium sp. So ce375]|uniref:hypothetical protein n=1 Tax=Sorangium sp. So ce375 TaxID=3133306 RepID=UPI003F5B221D
MSKGLDGESVGTVMLITNDELLSRRFHIYQLKEDGTASSGAFTDPDMSVDRASMRTIDESLSEYPYMGVAQIVAGEARSLEQEVVPVPQLLNLAHAEVRGKKTKAIAKKLARSSVVVRAPKAVADAETTKTEATQAGPRTTE